MIVETDDGGTVVYRGGQATYRQPVTDVCIAGESASDGVCGNPECVCDPKWNESQRIESGLRDSFETTLSARVVVTVAIHPYFGEHCYVVRSRAGHKFNWLCEVIGQPQCRAWFAAYELTDERHFDGRKDF